MNSTLHPQFQELSGPFPALSIGVLCDEVIPPACTDVFAALSAMLGVRFQLLEPDELAEQRQAIPDDRLRNTRAELRTALPQHDASDPALLDAAARTACALGEMAARRHCAGLVYGYPGPASAAGGAGAGPLAIAADLLNARGIATSGGFDAQAVVARLLRLEQD